MLPAALAETLAVEAEAVAAGHDAGDPCGAAARARRLQRTTIAAIGDVPSRFQEQLQGSVNDLVDRSARACAAVVPPPSAPAPVDVPTPPPPPALAPPPNVQPGKLKPGKLKPGKSKGKRRKHDDDEEDED